MDSSMWNRKLEKEARFTFMCRKESHKSCINLIPAGSLLTSEEGNSKDAAYGI